MFGKGLLLLACLVVMGFSRHAAVTGVSEDTNKTEVSERTEHIEKKLSNLENRTGVLGKKMESLEEKLLNLLRNKTGDLGETADLEKGIDMQRKTGDLQNMNVEEQNKMIALLVRAVDLETKIGGLEKKTDALEKKTDSLKSKITSLMKESSLNKTAGLE